MGGKPTERRLIRKRRQNGGFIVVGNPGVFTKRTLILISENN
jgi:hypothetical protein